MTVIRTYSRLQQADLHRSILQAHGIPVELRNENNTQLIGHGGIATGGVTLAVPENYVDDAIDLIGDGMKESLARSEELHQSLKRATWRFIGTMVVIALALLLVKGFRLSLIIPSLGMSFMATSAFFFLTRQR